MNATATDAGYIWTDAPPNADGAYNLNGAKAFVSNNVSSALTKGSITTCSSIFFGAWNNLLIGEWGSLDVVVDNITLIKSGGIRVRVFQDVDIAVRQAAAFSAMLDALAG